MAARLELYGVVDGHHLEHYDDDVLAAAEASAGADASAAQPSFLGFVSASDEDEQLLYDVLSAVAEHTAIDARTHGHGLVPAADLADTTSCLTSFATELPSELQLAAGEQVTAQEWLASLAAGAAKAGGTQLAWRMHYDRGGSTDDGPDEFPTAHS